MSGGGGSQPAGNTTSTQNTTATPWSGQQPYLAGGVTATGGTVPGAGSFSAGAPITGTMGAANQLYQNYTPQYFPQSTVAQFNPTQQAGLGAETQFGNSGGSSSVGASNNALTNIGNGNFLSAGNPYFQNMASHVLSQTIPGLESTFNGGNRMNSPGAAFAVSQGANTALGNIAYQNYNDQIGNMVKSAALAPGVQQAQQAPYQALQDAGNQRQTLSQANINDLINRWNFQQQLPYNKLANYEQMIQGNFGGTQVGTTTQPFFAPNHTAQDISTGLSAAASAAVIGSIIANCDRRLKVVGRVYESALDDLDKITISMARYHTDESGTDRPMVMADEIKEVLPNAVIGETNAVNENGDPIYQKVDHAQLVPVLIAAVQELRAELATLKGEIASDAAFDLRRVA